MSDEEKPKIEVPEVAIKACKEALRELANKVDNMDVRIEQLESEVANANEAREDMIIQAADIGAYLEEHCGLDGWNDVVDKIHSGKTADIDWGDKPVDLSDLGDDDLTADDVPF